MSGIHGECGEKTNGRDSFEWAGENALRVSFTLPHFSELVKSLKVIPRVRLSH